MNLKGIQIPQNSVTSGTRLRSLHLDLADYCVDLNARMSSIEAMKCYNYKMPDSVKIFPKETLTSANLPRRRVLVGGCLIGGLPLKDKMFFSSHLILCTMATRLNVPLHSNDGNILDH